MTASSVAIISVCIAFTGLMITVFTKLMSVSVKYGELIKMVDIIQQQARTQQKNVEADIVEIKTRLASVERDQTDTAVIIARIDENMQTMIRQFSKLEAKLDKNNEK